MAEGGNLLLGRSSSEKERRVVVWAHLSSPASSSCNQHTLGHIAITAVTTTTTTTTTTTVVSARASLCAVSGCCSVAPVRLLLPCASVTCCFARVSQSLSFLFFTFSSPTVALRGWGFSSTPWTPLACLVRVVGLHGSYERRHRSGCEGGESREAVARWPDEDSGRRDRVRPGLTRRGRGQRRQERGREAAKETRVRTEESQRPHSRATRPAGSSWA